MSVCVCVICSAHIFEIQSCFYSISFVPLNSIPEYITISIHCPIHGHKNCFEFGAVMNKDVINILILFL